MAAKIILVEIGTEPLTVTLKAAESVVTNVDEIEKQVVKVRYRVDIRNIQASEMPESDYKPCNRRYIDNKMCQ